MAALRGTIRGDRRRANSDARSTRLADRVINVHADTWRTFCEVELRADGSGRLTVRQNDGALLRATWSAETSAPTMVGVSTVGDHGMAAGILGGAE
jgi:hypothetical protein